MTESKLHPSTVGVDILRGVAILMVIAYHAAGPIWGYSLPWDGSLRDFAQPPSQQILWFYPVTFAWVGVPLFFVISGFCIHYSYLRSGPFNARNFFWRRSWRIYPAYFVALLVFLLTSYWGLFSHWGAHQFLTHALFVHNKSFEKFFGVNPSFWSIAVEVQLYLLFPLLLWMRNKIGISKSLAALFAVGCAWRGLTLSLSAIPDHVITPAFTCPLMCWFDWALGALVAERFAAGERTFRRPSAWFAIALTLFVASTFYKPATVFSFTLAAAASAVLLDASLHVRWAEGKITRLLVFTGTISYSLYLWHQPLLAPIVSMATTVTSSPIAGWLMLLPTLLFVAWLSYVLLERPGIGAERWLWRAFAERRSSEESTVPGFRGLSAEMQHAAATPVTTAAEQPRKKSAA